MHHACWVGDPDAVGRLLERGADPPAPSGGRVRHAGRVGGRFGSQYDAIAGRYHVALMERLVKAGADLAPRFAEGPLADWLDERR